MQGSDETEKKKMEQFWNKELGSLMERAIDLEKSYESLKDKPTESGRFSCIDIKLKNISLEVLQKSNPFYGMNQHEIDAAFNHYKDKFLTDSTHICLYLAE